MADLWQESNFASPTLYKQSIIVIGADKVYDRTK